VVVVGCMCSMVHLLIAQVLATNDVKRQQPKGPAGMHTMTILVLVAAWQSAACMDLLNTISSRVRLQQELHASIQRMHECGTLPAGCCCCCCCVALLAVPAVPAVLMGRQEMWNGCCYSGVCCWAPNYNTIK
jgi:hypothetical protein